MPAPAKVCQAVDDTMRTAAQWNGRELVVPAITSRSRRAASWRAQINAPIRERPVIEKIRTHLGLNPQPPPNDRALSSDIQN
jgi:hypothetical protein